MEISNRDQKESLNNSHILILLQDNGHERLSCEEMNEKEQVKNILFSSNSCNRIS